MIILRESTKLKGIHNSTRQSRRRYSAVIILCESTKLKGKLKKLRRSALGVERRVGALWCSVAEPKATSENPTAKKRR